MPRPQGHLTAADARKAPAKKAPAKKPSAAVAARREVRGEKGKPPPLNVRFRGESFVIPLDRLGSARVDMRFKYLTRFPTEDAVVDVLFDLLGQVDSARLINLCKPGDTIVSIFNEFIPAANKAANVPNS